MTKTYQEPYQFTVFKNLNLDIYEGEFLGLFAPSGYGKSTLIHLIAGLDKPDSGEIWINGKRIDTMSEYEAALFRRENIGIVFQFFNLFPNLTALENVMLPLELLNVKRSEAKKKALDLLDAVGLKEKANNFPSQLSGGEQQRVAIARGLANDPIILLADEPTGNLDEKNAVHIFELLQRLNRDKGVTILVATHDIEHAKDYVTRAVTIKDYKIVELE